MKPEKNFSRHVIAAGRLLRNSYALLPVKLSARLKHSSFDIYPIPNLYSKYPGNPNHGS